MSFVSTGNKSGSNGGPAITTPPIAGESSAVSAGSAATDVADAAEQMAEQAAADLFGALPEPSGLVNPAAGGGGGGGGAGRRCGGRDLGYGWRSSGCGGVACSRWTGGA